MALDKSQYRSYLEPALISKLASLELKARNVVEGFMVGLHKSPYHGFSVEFSEHRPYMQGDQLKDIDWKVYAKSDRYYIKQYEEETNLIAHIFLDVSKSMDFKNQGSITKLEYAKILAASLSYMLIQQQDSVGLGLFSDRLETYLPPKSSRIYLKNILTEINNVSASNKTNTADCLSQVSEKIKRRGMVILISDFFDDIAKVLSALKKLHYKKNDVILFQILDPIEQSFAFDRSGVFVDLESGEEMTTQPLPIKASYREAFIEYLTKLKKECLSFGIEYNLINTNEPFDTALLSFIKRRSKLL